MYKFSPCGWISLGTGCTGCPPWLYGFADFFASDALNLLFRANSALLNLLFRDFLDSEPYLQYVPDLDHGNGCTKKCHVVSSFIGSFSGIRPSRKCKTKQSCKPHGK